MRKTNLPSSRRNFFKTGLVVAGSVVATGLLKPFNAVVFASKEPKGNGPWYGIGIDIEKCIGCGRCARSCKKENNVPEEPFYFRSWVEQYTIKKNGEVVVESPNGGIDGFRQSVPDEEIFKSFFVPKMCNHCHKSPCVQVCPVGATFDSPEGIVLVDENYCIGCKYCVQACPYGCRYLHPEKKVVDKCTLCFHRLKRGLMPACFETCPTKARIYGNLRDKSDPIVEFIRNHTCMVLKPNLNTGSKLFYNALSMEVR
jgi:tetrathionate reductase subunit B